MDLRFLRFCAIFGVWVVLWLYGFFSLFTTTEPLKFRRLRLKENLDTIVVLEGLAMLLRDVYGKSQSIYVEIKKTHWKGVTDGS